MSKKVLWYVLVGHNPVPCDDIEVLGKWFENADRQVALTEKNGISVSTVFLAMNHSFGNGEPILFETMVFGGNEDIQERYRTWDEAVEGHAKICREVFGE